jgi:two-component system, NtrC family, sensor kinase
MNYSRFLEPFVALLFALSSLILWEMARHYPFPPLAVFLIFIGVLYILTNYKIKIPRVANEISVTWPVTFFGLWLWGPWIGVTLMIAIFIYIGSQIIGEWKLFKEYCRDYVLSTAYNVAYCCLITCLPAMLYFRLGGTSLFTELTPHLMLTIMVSALSCYVISSLTTNIRIALFENSPPWKLCIDPLSELMELTFVSFSIIAVIIFNRLGGLYLLFLIIPAILGLYLLNFAIKAATEKDDVSLLFDFASLMTVSLNLEVTMSNIAMESMHSINADGCAIYLLKKETGLFKPQRSLGTLSGTALALQSDLEKPFAEAIRSIEKSVSSFKESEGIKEAFFPALGGELLVVSLSDKQRIIGFLLLNKNQFERDHRNFLGILSSQAATALSNASLYLQALETHQQLRAIQAQLVQSSKMSAVGQMAAGVAHRLNRPMKTILQNFNKVSTNLEKSEKLERRLNISQRALIRCLDIHEKLLHYTQKAEAVEEEIDIRALVDDTMELLIKLLEKDNVEIRLVRSEIPRYRGNADYLSQVLTNLVLNAKDALIASENTPKIITIEAWKSDGNLCLAVRDNGTGMSNEVRERIFEPFYTTKDIGLGTGLGLSVSLEIIKRSGGTIQVESTPGNGSSFIIELPYVFEKKEI